MIKIGCYVIVKSIKYGHNFFIGEELRVVAIDPEFLTAPYRCTNGMDTWWLGLDELKYDLKKILKKL
jgi:hypothetical protein